MWSKFFPPFCHSINLLRPTTLSKSMKTKYINVSKHQMTIHMHQLNHRRKTSIYAVSSSSGGSSGRLIGGPSCHLLGWASFVCSLVWLFLLFFNHTLWWLWSSADEGGIGSGGNGSNEGNASDSNPHNFDSSLTFNDDSQNHLSLHQLSCVKHCTVNRSCTSLAFQPTPICWWVAGASMCFSSAFIHRYKNLSTGSPVGWSIDFQLLYYPQQTHQSREPMHSLSTTPWLILIKLATWTINSTSSVSRSIYCTSLPPNLVHTCLCLSLGVGTPYFWTETFNISQPTGIYVSVFLLVPWGKEVTKLCLRWSSKHKLGQHPTPGNGCHAFCTLITHWRRPPRESIRPW